MGGASCGILGSGADLIRWLKEGAHVSATGSPRPTWRELDDEAMHSMLIVASREASLSHIDRKSKCSFGS